MMGEQILSLCIACLSAAATICVAVIETKAAKGHKRSEECAKRRETESKLSMELISASVDLSYVTSLAVTGGHTNGNVEAAQKKAKVAQDNYEAFLRAETAHAVAKV